MGIFSKREKEENLFLLFDVGSASVGGALFKAGGSRVPEVIFCARESIDFEEKIEPEKFFSSTLRALNAVTGKIHLSGLGRPEKIFCVLSSPWYVSQTRFIKLEKNTPFVFTEKVADELIQKEIEILEKENTEKFGKESKKIRPIEFKSMKTFLNGYPIANPYGKKARILEMPAFISAGAEKILKKMEQTIRKHFHTENVKFMSFAMAQFAVARDVWRDKENFLLVDIAGEVTDVSIVKKEVLHNSVSYPLGRNFIIRKIAQEFGFTLNEAESVISLYIQGHADKSLLRKILPFMKEAESDWLRGFQQSLIKISNDISIPADVFMSADRQFEKFFGDIIETEQFSQYTLTESKFRVVPMNTEILHGLASFKEGVKRDPFIIAGIFYASRFLLAPALGSGTRI